MQTRRQILASTGLAACATLGAAAPAPRQTNPIQRENTLPCTTNWLLEKTQIDPVTKYRCPWIEGYASHQSISAGQTVKFYVSTNPPSEFSIDIYRMGFYRGKGGRLVANLGPFTGEIQPDPPEGDKRLRNCGWKVSAAWIVPMDAVSGVYVGKLTAKNGGWQSYVIFIVKDTRKADYLFQCSDHTWQAYNRWPSQFALYDDGKSQWYWGKDVKVSFNRPYGKYCQILDQPLSTGSGEFFLWEFPFVHWLEEQGLDVSYISNTDTHHDGPGLRRAKGFLSVGHDEYWTAQMFSNVQGAISDGVSVGFFSGNAVCGKIAWDATTRAFERVGVFGPPGGTFEFDSMSGLTHERPYANELVGAHSTGPVTGGADWTCVKPEHWVFAGTGMKTGEGIPGLVGWEWHGDPAPIPGLEILATGPTQSAVGKPNGGQFTATIYPGPKGNFVFNAATCWWADALCSPPGYKSPSVYISPKGPDKRARKITRNILDRMLH